MNKELILSVQNLFSLQDTANNGDELLLLLTEKINHLIMQDFDKLIQILYRIDVSEAKLKTLLKENANQDASSIIAQLIIERQKEKIESRRKYSSDTDFSEEEKW